MYRINFENAFHVCKMVYKLNYGQNTCSAPMNAEKYEISQKNN